MKKIEKLKKFICIGLCILMSLSSFSYAYAEVGTVGGLTAVENKKFKDWVAKGYVTRYENGTFKQNVAVTRAELAEVINKVFQLTVTDKTNFNDVKKKDAYYKSMAIAKKAGYFTADKKGFIKPKGAVSRQELAQIIMSVMKLEKSEKLSGLSQLKDGKQVVAMNKYAVEAVVRQGYMQPDADGNFRPKANITKVEALGILDKCLETVKVAYDKAGIYSAGFVAGSVSINVKGVTLENTVIKGDLIIGQGIGEGNLDLKNVTVSGDTIVYGGGMNSIIVKDCTFYRIIVMKIGNMIRVVASGSTSASEVEMRSGGKLEESGLTGSGFGQVTLYESIDTGAAVSLIGNFENIEIQGDHIRIDLSEGKVGNLAVASTAENTNINLGKGSEITNLTMLASTNIGGTGTIETANVNANGTAISTSTGRVIVAPGITAPIMPTGNPSGGTGAAGGNTGGNGGSIGGTGNNGGADSTGGTGSTSHPGKDKDTGGGPTITPINMVSAINSITGTEQVGSVLTAGKLTPAGATVSYQWQICATSGGVYTNIAGATSSTYKPVAGDATKFIKVVVTGTGSYSGTQTSAATAAISALSSSANLDFTAVTGTKLAAVVLTNNTGAQTGADEARAMPLSVTIANINKAAAVFAPVSTNATVTAYTDAGAGSGTYATLAANYDFSGANTTLWLKVVSQDLSETRHYKVTVTVAAALSSSANLDFTAVTGTKLAAVVLTNNTGAQTGADEAHAMPLSVTIANINKAAAVFAPVSTNATVTAYTDAGAGSGTYATLAVNYDFSGANTTLWLKAVSQDLSATRYYKVTVTVAAALSSSANLDFTAVTGTKLAAVVLTNNTGAQTGADEAHAMPLSVTIANINKAAAVFAPVSTNATVTAYTDAGAGSGTYATLAANYDFSGANTTLWLKVVSQDLSETRHYKVTVTVAAALSSSANLDFTAVTGTKLAAVVLTNNTGAQTGADEAHAMPLSVTIANINKAAAVFAPVSTNATVTAYTDAGAGSGTYATLAVNYDFSGANTTLWLKAVSQDLSATRYYKVTVTVAAALSSSANLDFTAVTGTKLAAVVLTNNTGAQTGADEAHAMPLSVTIANINKAAAVFAPVSTNATVTAYTDAGAGSGTYATLAANYDFSGANTTLWVKVVSQDLSATRYYKVIVTIAATLFSEFGDNRGDVSGNNMHPYNFSQGSLEEIQLLFRAKSDLTNATIVYDLGPLTADTNDYYSWDAAGVWPHLTDINGHIVTINGVNLSAGKAFVLWVGTQSMPVAGNYVISISINGSPKEYWSLTTH